MVLYYGDVMKNICYVILFSFGFFYNPSELSTSMMIHRKTPINEDVNPIDKYINKYAKEYNVDVELIRAVIEAESNFRTKVKSPKGAIGLMQLMPSTAEWLGVDPNCIEGNIKGGIKYLAMNIKTFEKTSLALAAYNAGPGNVHKYGKKIPPFKETQNYVKKICSKYTCPHYENVLYIQQLEG